MESQIYPPLTVSPKCQEKTSYVSQILMYIKNSGDSNYIMLPSTKRVRTPDLLLIPFKVM